jgi:hypothetical protein
LEITPTMLRLAALVDKRDGEVGSAPMRHL